MILLQFNFSSIRSKVSIIKIIDRFILTYFTFYSQFQIILFALTIKIADGKFHS